jgi:hypothetical protein
MAGVLGTTLVDSNSLPPRTNQAWTVTGEEGALVGCSVGVVLEGLETGGDDGREAFGVPLVHAVATLRTARHDRRSRFTGASTGRTHEA